PLEVTRLRLEPRLLSPAPLPDPDASTVIQIAGLGSRDEAEAKSKDVREAIAEGSQVTFDETTKTWGLVIGAPRSAIEAEELRARLEDAGIEATVTAPTPTRTANTSTSPTIGVARYPLVEKNVAQQNSALRPRPAARFSSPTREVVALAPGTGRLFSS